MHDLGDAQDVGRGALLGDARGGQLLGRHVRILGALAAVGGHDVVDPRARRGRAARWSPPAPNSASSGWLITTSARSSGLISSWRSRGLMRPMLPRFAGRSIDRSGAGPHTAHQYDDRCRRDAHFRHCYTKDKRDLVTRLRRIEGQARGIQRLVDEEAYCLDVLQQVEALTAAADQVGAAPARGSHRRLPDARHRDRPGPAVRRRGDGRRAPHDGPARHRGDGIGRAPAR